MTSIIDQRSSSGKLWSYQSNKFSFPINVPHKATLPCMCQLSKFLPRLNISDSYTHSPQQFHTFHPTQCASCARYSLGNRNIRIINCHREMWPMISGVTICSRNQAWSIVQDIRKSDVPVRIMK
jgi:hypothetical protein